MKNFIIILLVTLLFTGCFPYEKYEEPSLLSLSGEYIVDRITDGNVTYLPSDQYTNPNASFPIDNIAVGVTKWHLDYSVISFAPYPTPTGTTIWTKQYFYKTSELRPTYDLGYLEFTTETSRQVFKILEDGMESLTLRSSGIYGTNVDGVTIHLTRVGP